MTYKMRVYTDVICLLIPGFILSSLSPVSMFKKYMFALCSNPEN